MDLNILIRTLLYGHGEVGQGDPGQAGISGDGEGRRRRAPATVWGQVGAGIVADSQPDREWRESLQKAKAQLLALGITLADDRG